ncbi:MAG: hypothetical protein ACI4XS_05065, partial [Bacillus sp. (in: firmicutes)]
IQLKWIVFLAFSINLAGFSFYFLLSLHIFCIFVNERPVFIATKWVTLNLRVALGMESGRGDDFMLSTPFYVHPT